MAKKYLTDDELKIAKLMVNALYEALVAEPDVDNYWNKLELDDASISFRGHTMIIYYIYYRVDIQAYRVTIWNGVLWEFPCGDPTLIQDIAELIRKLRKQTYRAVLSGGQS